MGGDPPGGKPRVRMSRANLSATRAYKVNGGDGKLYSSCFAAAVSVPLRVCSIFGRPTKPFWPARGRGWRPSGRFMDRRCRIAPALCFAESKPRSTRSCEGKRRPRVLVPCSDRPCRSPASPSAPRVPIDSTPPAYRSRRSYEPLSSASSPSRGRQERSFVTARTSLRRCVCERSPARRPRMMPMPAKSPCPTLSVGTADDAYRLARDCTWVGGGSCHGRGKRAMGSPRSCMQTRPPPAAGRAKSETSVFRWDARRERHRSPRRALRARPRERRRASEASRAGCAGHGPQPRRCKSKAGALTEGTRHRGDKGVDLENRVLSAGTAGIAKATEGPRGEVWWKS